MRHFISLILFIAFTTVIFSSCDDTGITDIIIPDENVDYSLHIQPLFNEHCNNSGCHNSEDNAGGIRLTSYGELFAVPFLIIPGSPDESQLFLAVDGQSVNFMPPPYGNSVPLSENNIQGIRTWILEGAEAD